MTFNLQIPGFVHALYPGIHWKMPPGEKVLYLTFDDGPIPGVTPMVLDLLEQHDAKATFFCIGRNVERHPGILNNILDGGHSVGNHGYSHVRGLFRDHKAFLEDVKLASRHVPSNLFRPPHGNINRKLIQSLNNNYHLVLWDVLSYDYHPKNTPEKCTRIVKKHAKPGSIIVFHDSLKAKDNMLPTLKECLTYFSGQGYQFKPLVF